MSVRANIDILSWESDFFGRRLGCVLFDDTAADLTPAALDAFSLVQVKVAAQAVVTMDALSAIGFRPVEGEIDCCYTLSFSQVCSDSMTASAVMALPVTEIRQADEADIPALRKLAAETLELSRFQPPWFSNDERRRFYAQWAENAVRGSFDHFSLVAEGSGGIEGLVTLRDIGEQAARIGLLAVAPAVRGHGIGQLLYQTALSWCSNHGFRQLWVATQTTNMPALQLYLASGAMVVHAAYWLYRGPHDSI